VSLNTQDKNLGRGLLSAAQAALYTVQTGFRADITSIILVNTDTAARTVNIWHTSGSTSRRISPKDGSMEPGDMWVLGDGLVLSSGDSLDGAASVANVISYEISGHE
jgi:hypothetical protein